MRTHLVATIGIALAMALGAAGGCGSEAAPPATDEETASQDDAMMIDVPHYYTVRRDMRKCAFPLCGGWFLREANTDKKEVYVASLDFSRAPGFEAGETGVVTGAPPADLVLRGTIEVGRPWLELAVTEAFRGMPGFTPAPEDAYYVTYCLDTECREAIAHEVGTRRWVPFKGLSVENVQALLASEEWLVDRVEHHGALVAGHIVGAHWSKTGSWRSELAASQVYVKLPAAAAGSSCRVEPPTCPSGRIATFTRDADLCLDFAACVAPGICPMMIPACAEGYTRVSWPAGAHACPAFACDPAFIHE